MTVTFTVHKHNYHSFIIKKVTEINIQKTQTPNMSTNTATYGKKLPNRSPSASTASELASGRLLSG